MRLFEQCGSSNLWEEGAQLYWAIVSPKGTALYQQIERQPHLLPQFALEGSNGAKVICPKSVG